jgi:hypothetical protein
MKRFAFLGALVGILSTACGSGMPAPTSTSTHPSTQEFLGSAGTQRAASAIPPDGPASAPADNAPQTVVWQAGSAQSVERVSFAGTARVFDGARTISSPSAVGGSALTDAGPPSLDQPVVDPERRTVSVEWHRGFGDPPLKWLVEYTAPGGLSGTFEFATGTMSLSAGLPFDGPYTLRVCAFNGASGCQYSATRAFSLQGRLPGAVTNAAWSANGTTLTVSWAAPASGGAPTTYVVLFQGATYPLGLVTSGFATVAPGRYLIVVFARNAAGDGPPVTLEATVVGTATAGTYRGTFTGTGSFVKGTCTWRPTYTGTIIVALTQSAAGLTGTIRVTGSESEPAGTSSDPNRTCSAGGDSFDSTNPAIISGANIARSGIDMSAALGVFNGNLAGTAITGSLTANYSLGTGSIPMSVTLNRQ